MESETVVEKKIKAQPVSMAAIQDALMMEMRNAKNPCNIRMAMQADSVFVLITRNQYHVASFQLDTDMEQKHQEEVFRNAVHAIRQA